MGKGLKTPPEVIERIKVAVACGQSYSQVARDLGIPVNTVSTIMKGIREDKEKFEEFEKLKAQKKKEMQEKANEDFNELMKKSFETLFEKSVKVIDKAIDKNLLTPRDAVTIMGTTFDKRQILYGKSTSNVTVNFEDLLKEINKGNEF